MNIPLTKISEIIQGSAVTPFGPEIVATGVSTDTRTLKTGDLFFALTGPNFDGHKFLEDAKSRGAIGAVVSSEQDIELSQISVQKPLKALGDFAHWYRRQFQIPVVAVTGSNGKTTTKDFLSSILSQSKKVLATEGNLNNLIGVPQMVFRLEQDFQVAIFELGMSIPGEIDRLTEIVSPEFGVITNIGHAHLEFMESIERVAEAKYELWKRMDHKGTAIINLDDPAVTKIAERWNGKSLTFSTSIEHADVVLNILTTDENGKSVCELLIRDLGKVEVSIPIIGFHNIYNAAAAAATAHAMKVPIKDIATGIRETKVTSMRSEVFIFSNDRTLINDAYNANPNSVEASLKSLSMMTAKKESVAILGDMLELGDRSEDLHIDVGNFVGEMKIDHLVTFGKLAKRIADGATQSGMPTEKVSRCSSVDEVLEVIAPLIEKSGMTLLVKGSRGMKMEEIVLKLKEQMNR